MWLPFPRGSTGLSGGGGLLTLMMARSAEAGSGGLAEQGEAAGAATRSRAIQASVSRAVSVGTMAVIVSTCFQPPILFFQFPILFSALECLVLFSLRPRS